MAMKKRVPRGGFVPEKSGEDEEMVVIYISIGMYERLKMPKMRVGALPCRTNPYPHSCFRTTVPKAAFEGRFVIARDLHGDFFHPNRCDVDALLNRCEKIDLAIPKDK